MFRNISKKYIKILSMLLLISISINNFSYAADIDFNEKDIKAAKHIFKNRSAEELEKLNDNVVLLEEIDELINMNNSTVRNNWNKFESNKDKMDVYDDYLDAYNILDSLAASADSEVQTAMYRAQADAMMMNADNNVVDSNINFLNYYIAEKNIALSTKISFINYFKSILNIEKLNYQYKQAVKTEETAKRNFDAGNITKVEYLTAKKTVDDIKASVIIAESNLQSNLRNTTINCGKNSGDVVLMNPEFVTSEQMANVNFYFDCSTALDSNIQFNIYKRQLENAMNQEMKKQNQIYVDSAANFIVTDIEKKYYDLTDANTAYDNAVDTYELAVKQYNQAKNVYEAGNMSKSDFQLKEYDVEICEIDKKLAQYDILIAYETYYAAVNGLASAGN